MAQVTSIALDASDSAAITAAVARIEAEAGRLDIVVNAAGINAPTRAANQALAEANMQTLRALREGRKPMFAFIEDTSDADFLTVMQVNLFSQFYTLRAAVPMMKRQGSGSVINISSVAALIGVTMPLYYPASKAAILGMTRSAAAELAPYGIRVNAVCPGGVDTPLMHEQPQEMVDFLTSIQPIQRLASPDELAETILFLADDSRGGYYTGQTLAPCGGIHM